MPEMLKTLGPAAIVSLLMGRVPLGFGMLYAVRRPSSGWV
jgi:hypothetical protein